MAVCAETVPAYKQATVQRVFDDLVAAIDDPMPPPVLRVVRDTNLVAAAFYRAEGVIRVEERFYDQCVVFGADSLNALASVLGHELAHYYRHHSTANRPKSFIGSLDFRHIALASDAQAIEAEADYYAGFYGRMAGYDVPRVMPVVVDRIYQAYTLPDDPPRYLTRAERQAVALRVDGMLQRLIPVFDAANYLALVRQYADAARCYDRVIADFPSRESLNNVGVVYTLHALNILDEEEMRFVYPLELDADTRLGGIDVSDGGRQVGSRGSSAADSALARALLDSAETRFTTARRMDPAYVSALINLATVYILKHQYRRAIDSVNKAIRLDTSRTGRILATTVLCIAQARLNRHEEARKGLANAVAEARGTSADDLVRANLAVLERADFSIPYSMGTGIIESIHGLRPTDTAHTWPADVYDSVGGEFGLAVVYKKLDNCCIIRAEKKRPEKRSGEKTSDRKQKSWVQVIYTRDSYGGATSRGVRIGTTFDDVKMHYGDTPRSVNTRGGKFYIYEYSKVIFLVGDDGRVKRWGVYAIG